MKDAKAKRRNTRGYTVPWREGRIWLCLEREVSKEPEMSLGADGLRDGGSGDPGPCGCRTCQADEVGETHCLHNPGLHLDVEEGSGRHPHFLVSLAQVRGPGVVSVGDGHCRLHLEAEACDGAPEDACTREVSSAGGRDDRLMPPGTGLLEGAPAFAQQLLPVRSVVSQQVTDSPRCHFWKILQHKRGRFGTERHVVHWVLLAGGVLGFTVKHDAAWRGSLEPRKQQQGISSCCLVPRKAPLSPAKRPEESLPGNSSALGAKRSTGHIRGSRPL